MLLAVGVPILCSCQIIFWLALASKLGCQFFVSVKLVFGHLLVWSPHKTTNPLTQHWTIPFYPALNHTLLPRIKPCHSIQHQTIPFDPASNHTLLPSIEPSVPLKIKAQPLVILEATPKAWTPLTCVSLSPCISVSMNMWLWVVEANCCWRQFFVPTK